jgi:tRNA modification GTPase
LREHIQIDGLPLHIVDTAGLRDSADEIEQEGIRRAWKEMESADHILLVMDSTQQSNDTIHDRDLWPERKQHLSRNIPLTVIQNKCDLSDTVPGLSELQGNTVINLSAKTGTGMDILKQHLKTSMGFQDSSENSFSARRRHLQSLVNAERFLSNGLQQLQDAGAGELLAEDLRQCQNCLGEITGKISSDELLGEIFSSFCIGK